MTSLADERVSAIHLLRAGLAVNQVALQLGHSARWVRKWQQRYRVARLCFQSLTEHVYFLAWPGMNSQTNNGSVYSRSYRPKRRRPGGQRWIIAES